MQPLSRLVGRAWGMTPRLRLHPGAGRPHPNADRPRVVVVGAGIAGMSAAIVLAERGLPVTVCEAAAYPGGRLSAEPHRLPDGTHQWVDHGFHGFFRQYYNWRSILRRIDPSRSLLEPLGSYPVISRGWPAEEFDGLPPTPPVSLAALLARSPSLRLRELRAVNQELGLCLLGFHPRRTYRALDDCSAADLLAALRLPDRARAMLFNVFAHSFFNDAAHMSAADLVAMFHFYFLANPEGLGMDAPRGDHHTTIWSPLADHLARHDGRILLSTPVETLTPAPDGGWRVHVGTGRPLAADHVVLAADARRAAELLGRTPALCDADPRLAAARDARFVGDPYAVSRYWLDGPVAPDRAMFSSIGQARVLDSVTAYHLVDPGAAAWHRRTGGVVLELHAYACPDGPGAAELGETMRAELAELWPETRALRVVDARHRVGRDAAGFPVGGDAHRPGVRGGPPGITLAGDWVAAPAPSALMERAATTGILAANEILARHGHPVEPVWSVPPEGMLADRWARQCRVRPPADAIRAALA